MIEWYNDTELTINFNIIPKLTIRYITKNLTKEEIKKINKKPFLNLENLEVELIDKKKNKKYSFLIIKNYVWDGASIPRFFWRLIGSKNDPKFLIPSLIHDVLCENHNLVDNDRYFSTKIFERLLYVSNVNLITRLIIFHSVDNFQKFCRW